MKKFLFLMLIPTMVAAQQTINGLNIKGKLDVISTTKSSNPCPSMTEVQRDLIIVPATGSCVYNTSALSLNIYDGAEWKSAGGGGISLWLTLTNYKTDDVVIDSNKIYKSLSDHTSGTFATDLLNGDWVEISANDPLVLTGEATNVGSVVTLDNDAVIAKELTGFTSAAGTITATDTILSALQKADGNAALKLGSTQSNVDVSPVATTQLNTPASQLTTVDTSTRLIETGNTNLLANPGFESNVVPTCTTGTPTLDATTFFPGGKQSMKLAVTGTGGRCVFSIPSGTAAMLKGQQMFLRARINSTDSALKVCSVENGVDNNCKDVAVTSVNRLWDTVEIPFIADGTSNGLVIKTVTTSAQSIYIDDLVISTGLPNLVGLAGDTVYSAKISSTGVISNVNIPGWLTSCSITAGVGSCIPKASLTQYPLNCTGNVSDSASASADRVVQFGVITNSLIPFFTTGNATNNSYPLTISCQKSGADYANASSSAYLSTNGNTDKTFYSPSITGMGTISSPSANYCSYLREGAYLNLDCFFTMGTGSAGIVQIPLPNGLTIYNDGGVLLRPFGKVIQGAVNSGNQDFSVLGASSNSYLNVGNQATNQGLIAVAGNTLTSNQPTAFTARVPIQGWSNSNLIVGSFEGIEKCANAYECTDTMSFTATSSNGPVSGMDLPNWITGCTWSSGIATCSINSSYVLTSSLNCTANGNADASNRVNYLKGSSTTSTVVFQGSNGSSLVNSAAVPFTAVCKKTGTDSKPKTAKVASSIGVPTVPGITTQAIDTFSVSYGTGSATTVCSASPCSYLDQIGNAVLNILRGSTGVYTLNLTKTYAKLKCTLSVYANGTATAGVEPGGLTCSSCNSVTFQTKRTDVVTLVDTTGTIDCKGTF